MDIEKQAVLATADYKGLSDQERRIFKSVVDDMCKRGIIKRTDAPIIASYSRNVLLARLAMIEIQKYGVLINVEDKYHGTKLSENPAIQILNRAQKAYEESALKLGLTPVGRKRTRTEEKPEKTPLDDWMDANG